MLRFNLNISITMRELRWEERIEQATRLGFAAIECWWPHGADLPALARQIGDAGLTVVLCNFDGGSITNGERGFLNHPQRQAEFRAHVPYALEFAQRIGCTHMNALVGNWLSTESRSSQLNRVYENLAWVAEQAAQAGVTVLVEALNPWETPDYILTTSTSALQTLAAVNAPNLQFQYDVYHMQRSEGNIVATLGTALEQIGHIQVADSPQRHQPGTGELNYRFIFQALEQLGYAGWIGLEYFPRGSLAESLAWLPADRRQPMTLDQLRLP
ncbi:MAG: TIM barrel protein [Roseiflexaceae bacterium]